jgi:hypothetical protein
LGIRGDLDPGEFGARIGRLPGHNLVFAGGRRLRGLFPGQQVHQGAVQVPVGYLVGADAAENPVATVLA